MMIMSLGHFVMSNRRGRFRTARHSPGIDAEADPKKGKKRQPEKKPAHALLCSMAGD